MTLKMYLETKLWTKLFQKWHQLTANNKKPSEIRVGFNATQ